MSDSALARKLKPALDRRGPARIQELDERPIEHRRDEVGQRKFLQCCKAGIPKRARGKSTGHVLNPIGAVFTRHLPELGNEEASKQGMHRDRVLTEREKAALRAFCEQSIRGCAKQLMREVEACAGSERQQQEAPLQRVRGVLK